MKSYEQNMIQGPSGRQIFFFALPLMVGNIFQQAYILADTAVVGQVVGVNALAALGSVLLLIFFYEKNLRRLLLQTTEKTGEDLCSLRFFSIISQNSRLSRTLRLFLPVLFCQFHDFLVFSCNIPVSFPLMRQQTVAAVLDPFLCILKISPALITQGIQGTVAEKTVKILRVAGLMTGKKFTFFMTEKGIIFPFPIGFFLTHGSLLSSRIHADSLSC